MKFLIYDFEVFLHDWLVVFKIDGKHVVFVNDYEGVKDFYKTHEKDIFVGYNNKHYDDYILKGILSELNPKAINDWIIVQEKNGYDFPGIAKDIRFVSVDLMDDISGAIGISLKEIESNLGLSIEESNISFDIDRKLTDEEIEETIHYCKHDVDATEKLFEVRGDYIRSKLQLINKFKLPLSNLRMTNAQLTAEVMKARKRKHDDYNIYDKPACVGLKNLKILDFFKNPQDGSRKLNMDIVGVPHTIGYGGLHGAIKQAHFKGDLYNFDVSSYYPSMIISMDFMSRNVKEEDKKIYRNIRDERFIYKKQGNSLANAYKLVLNTLFGAMGSEYNKLYDLKMNRQVCITGQMLLVELIENLAPYIKLVQLING